MFWGTGHVPSLDLNFSIRGRWTEGTQEFNVTLYGLRPKAYTCVYAEEGMREQGAWRGRGDTDGAKTASPLGQLIPSFALPKDNLKGLQTGGSICQASSLPNFWRGEGSDLSSLESGDCVGGRGQVAWSRLVGLF